MKKVISLKIDVSKIEKDRLYQGKKGTYLDAVCFYDDEKDQYGNNGMIVQSVSKEERENGVQGPILGNAKTFESNGRSSGNIDSSVELDDVDDNLPF